MPTISIPGGENLDVIVYGRAKVIVGGGNDTITIFGPGTVIG